MNSSSKLLLIELYNSCEVNVDIKQMYGCVKISLVSQKRFCSLITKCSISKFDEKQSGHFRILYLKSNAKNIVKSQQILYTDFLIPEKPFSNGSASSLARALWAIDTDNMVSADTALMDSLKSIYGIITKDIFVLDAPLAVI